MLVETQYFPSIKFWAQAQKTGEVKLEKYENYQKRSYRNKCLILAANGVLTLSIPLKKGKNNRLPITEVEISYEENWQKIHLTSLKSAYTSSPYYEFYIDEIEALLMNSERFLYDYNFRILDWFSKQLSLILLESKEYNKIEINDLRHVLLPKSRDLNYPSYMQVFSDKFSFASDLSILDLLFCKGPEMGSYLRKIAKDI